MAAVLRRRKMREGSVTGLTSQWDLASYAGNQFPQHLTLSPGSLDLGPELLASPKYAAINIPQRHRPGSNTANAPPTLLKQSRDARSLVHACWRGG